MTQVNLQKAFRTAKGLEAVIDNSHKLDGVEDWLDSIFAEMYEIDLNEPCEVLYWIENYQDDKYMVEYNRGHYEPYRIGDTITINKIDYTYVDTVLLDEEVEHQIENGDLVYEYRGTSYLRVLETN